MQVTPSAGNDFVTIRDYISGKSSLKPWGSASRTCSKRQVSAVHPWLMGLRADILRAKTVSRLYSWAADTTEWMVYNRLAPQPEIVTKEYWIERHSPPRPMDASTLRIVQRIRAGIPSSYSTLSHTGPENPRPTCMGIETIVLSPRELQRNQRDGV